MKKGDHPRAVSSLAFGLNDVTLCFYVGNNYPALRLVPLGMRSHLVVINESQVHYTAVIGIHGSHRNAPMLLLRPRGRRTSELSKLFTAAALIALDINDDRIVELESIAQIGRNNHLEGIQGLAVSADENRKVATADVQNEFAFVAVILVNRNVLLAKEAK